MTRKHKRFVKDCMGLLHMSRNESEHTYQSKGFEYVGVVCDIRIRRGLLRAAKTILSAQEALKELYKEENNEMRL